MESVENIEIVESAETRVLKLEGSWTVERAHELKQILLDALKSGDHVVVESEHLEETDLSCAQLLCSAHHTFLRQGKNFALRDKKSMSFRRVVNDTGFKRKLGCNKNPHTNCLWNGEWGS